MPEVKLEQTDAGVRVEFGGWRVEHTAASGGAWTVAAPIANPDRNLLASPLSSVIHAASADGSIVEYRESLDKQAKLKSETGEIPAVVAEGVFRSDRGEGLPLGFRRRTEYHPHGIAWTTIELMSDCGCPDVVAVSALQVDLRPGMSDCHALLHPSQGGSPELFGASGRFSFTAPIAFQSRFTPIALNCSDARNEGIELLPGCDLPAWDGACKPNPGLGRYIAERRANATRLDLMPYCLINSRTPVTLQGKLSVRTGIALPGAVKHLGWNFTTYRLHAAEQIPPSKFDFYKGKFGCIHVEALYAETFWRAGQLPPYDAQHKASLREVVEAAHANGLKAIVSIPLREFHPAAPEFARNSPAWMHMAAASVGAIYTVRNNKPAEAIMCLNSGWAEQLERTIDHVLNDLPWDGVYFDSARPMPCCHPGHGRGPYHSDLEGLLRILDFTRKRTNVFTSKYAAANSIALANFAEGI